MPVKTKTKTKTKQNKTKQITKKQNKTKQKNKQNKKSDLVSSFMIFCLLEMKKRQLPCKGYPGGWKNDSIAR